MFHIRRSEPDDDFSMATVFRRNCRIILIGLILVILVQKWMGLDSFEQLMGEHLLLIPTVIILLWNWLRDRTLDGWAAAEALTGNISFFLLVLFIMAQHAVEWGCFLYNLGEYVILAVLVFHTVIGTLQFLIQEGDLVLTPTSRTVTAWVIGMIVGSIAFLAVEYLTKGLILPLTVGVLVTLVMTGIVTLLLRYFSRSADSEDRKEP